MACIVLAVLVLGAAESFSTSVVLERTQISAKDGSWHRFSSVLEPGRWYKVVLESSGRVSESESVPSQLHVLLDHGEYGRYTFLNENRAQLISEVIYINAQEERLWIKFQDAPGSYDDNTGTLYVTLLQIN